MSCRAKTKNSRVCKNHPRRGSDFCPAHLPKSKRNYSNVLQIINSALLLCLLVASFQPREPVEETSCEISLEDVYAYFFTSY